MTESDMYFEINLYVIVASVSPLSPVAVAEAWPLNMPRVGAWWSAPCSGAPRLRVNAPLRPSSLAAPHLPVAWPLTRTALGPPEHSSFDRALPAFLGVLPEGFSEGVARKLAGDSEVRLKTVRKALQRATPRLRARLLHLSYSRYCRSQGARHASWAAGSSAWIASSGADGLALQMHRRRRLQADARMARHSASQVAKNLARARVVHVARRKGLTAAAYRTSLGARRRNPPIPFDDLPLLDDFAPVPLRDGLRSADGRRRRRYHDSYVLAPDEGDFSDGLRGLRSVVTRLTDLHGAFL
jgi:hypothetical protein